MAEMQTALEKANTVRTLVQKQMKELAKAVPKGIDPARFARVALTTFNTNPRLLDCTPRSLLGAMMQAAAWGLELDPVMGFAYLVPYKDKCQLIIGYQGYIELGRRSGEIKSTIARVVHDGDEFNVEYGLVEKLTHKPLAPPGAKPIAFYAVVKLENGEVLFDWMWKEEVDLIRARSRAKDDGPWVTDYERMGCKTVIRRLYKYCPKSPELAAAIGMDEKTDLGMDQEFDQITALVEPEGGQEAPSKLDKLTAALPPAATVPAKAEAPAPVQGEPPTSIASIGKAIREQQEGKDGAPTQEPPATPMDHEQGQARREAARGPAPASNREATRTQTRRELKADDIFGAKREPGQEG